MRMLHDLIVAYQVDIREDINGVGMVLCGSLTLMIFVFMCNSWVHALRKHISMSAWVHMPGVPMACALLWVFGAETYRTGAIWHIYRFAPSQGQSSSAVGSFAAVSFWPTFGYMIAGGVLIGALLRCTFLFAPPFFRRIVWLTSTFVAVGFIIISHLTD
jgi:hypothetical protein